MISRAWLVSGALVCSAVLPLAAHPGIDDQIEHVSRQIAARPSDANLYLQRGELHRIHRDWESAEKDLSKARELDGEMTAVDLSLGKLRLEAKRPAAAKRALDAYVDGRPDDPEGHAYRGRALVAMGRPVQGAASFTRALAVMPEARPRPEYYLERARALESAGSAHLETALRGLDEGLARLGHPVVLQNYAIELELQRGQYDGALTRLDRLAESSRRKETWLVRRGEILESAGRIEEARSAYRGSLVAIGALPPSRRKNRAVTRLEEQATRALERLNEGTSAQ